jgi:hypothetical protein
MHGSICVVFLWAVAASLALPVSGQVTRNRTTTIEMAHPHTARLPYTAEFKITRVQRLANGTTITRESTETVAVDSQGRQMTATTTIPLSSDQTPMTHVVVNDPLTRTTSSWSVPGQRATIITRPKPVSVVEHSYGVSSTDSSATLPSCLENATSSTLVSRNYASGVPKEKPTVEDLGIETFQGIEAHGRRTTRTIPVGAIGNDAPLERVEETWVAHGFRDLLIHIVSDDPQTGKTDKEMTKFEQSEPDEATFQIPSGYEIVNKEAPASACPNSQSEEASPPQ